MTDTSTTLSIKGRYSRNLKCLFEALNKFCSSTIKFYLFANSDEVLLISHTPGSIICNMIKLTKSMFQEFKFNPTYSNSRNGYFCRFEFKEFESLIKLLETDQELRMEIPANDNELKFLQNITGNDLVIEKQLGLRMLYEEFANIESLSSAFVGNSGIVFTLELPNVSSFKHAIEKVFGHLRLENILIKFVLHVENKGIYIENLSSGSSKTKVVYTKFNIIKGDSREYKYKYSMKSLHQALCFFTKDANIQLKCDYNGTLFILSRYAETMSETAIPRVIE